MNVSHEEVAAIESVAIAMYASDNTSAPRYPWHLANTAIRQVFRTRALDMIFECRSMVVPHIESRRTPIKVVGSMADRISQAVGVKSEPINVVVRWPEVPRLKSASDSELDAEEQRVRAILGDDLEDTFAWAYWLLARYEGVGHKFQFAGHGGGNISVEFAKPEWTGSHVGDDREFAAWAVQRAVVEYLFGR